MVCSGASANARRPVAPEHALPTVLVVAVEPSRRNYELLTKHAREHGWGAEGFLALEVRSISSSFDEGEKHAEDDQPYSRGLGQIPFRQAEVRRRNHSFLNSIYLYNVHSYYRFTNTLVDWRVASTKAAGVSFHVPGSPGCHCGPCAVGGPRGLCHRRGRDAPLGGHRE